MKYIAVILSIICVGCIQIQPVVCTTKSYEGHFYSKDDAMKAIQTASLDKNESIWILSNTTLKRVLKDN